MWILLLILLQVQAQEGECHNCTTILPEFTPFTQTMRRQNNCARELSIGEGRVVNQRASRTIPVNRLYTLYRRDDRSYEAVFNLNFAGGTPAPSSPLAVNEMQERARRCVAMIPPINGPDGKRLRLRVSNDSDAQFGNTKPPRIDISVTRAPLAGETYRGSAADFQESFSCGTIVHELLHYAGLCDEYKEAVYTGDNDQSASCRPSGPADSIMSDGMLMAYDFAVGAPQSCDLSSDQNLVKFFNSNSPLKSVVMRRGFYDLQSMLWGSLGVQGPIAGNPMSLCCKRDTASSDIVATPETRRLSIVTASDSLLEFDNISYSISNTSTVRFYKNRFVCNPNAVPSNLRNACAQFVTHVKPQLMAAADPRLEMMSCPNGSKKQPPTRFDVAAGQRVKAGNIIHFRSRGNNRPLLHAGHFSRVLAGNCAAPQPDAQAANIYDQCAQFSYKHTQGNCAQRPAACNSDDWVGGLVRGF